MTELVARYDAVTYFAAPAASPLIHGLARDIGAGRVQVLPLPGDKR